MVSSRRFHLVTCNDPDSFTGCVYCEKNDRGQPGRAVQRHFSSQASLSCDPPSPLVPHRDESIICCVLQALHCPQRPGKSLPWEIKIQELAGKARPGEQCRHPLHSALHSQSSGEDGTEKGGA